MSLLATILAATEEPAPLLLPPLVFAGIALVVFTALAFVTWSFRDVANRHSDKTSKNSSHGAGH
ncbi:hypothetical protein BH11ACT4_BH11ACT4_10550 [soil metagenome]